MLPLLIAMGTVLFTIIGYALLSPDPVDEDAKTDGRARLPVRHGGA